jgi:hypothetical protein
MLRGILRQRVAKIAVTPAGGRLRRRPCTLPPSFPLARTAARNNFLDKDNAASGLILPSPAGGRGAGGEGVRKSTFINKFTQSCLFRSPHAQASDVLAAALIPSPRSAPHGLACKPNRLQRRKACFAKPRLRPACGRREHVQFSAANQVGLANPVPDSCVINGSQPCQHIYSGQQCACAGMTKH